MIRPILFALCLMAGTAKADVPVVAADIAPVHGLVAMVMGDLGTPGLILPPGASPHDHALRPSEARLLQNADLVFWIGPMLSPGLQRPLESLAGDAVVVALADASGTHLLTRREEAVFGADDHDHGHDHDHAHEGTLDPHMWLDPDNAILWLDAIAGQLSTLDPDNAQTYTDNATQGAKDIAAASARARAALDQTGGLSFVAFHDAYHYFEDAFGLTSLGSIALSDAAAPSPARLDALRTALGDTQVSCFVAEPGYAPGLIDAISQGTKRPVVIADPMGAEIPLGTEFYPALIADLSAQFASCRQAG